MDWCAVSFDKLHLHFSLAENFTQEHLGLGKVRQKEEILAKAMAKSVDQDAPYPLLSPLPDASSPPPSSQPRPNSINSSLSLTSLPSSFTSLLLSLVDSPAYTNLTSAYLNNTFNPSTPDDRRVKYFSVAGRLGGVGVWHPFWLPKMVLDGVEERTREKMQDEFGANRSESGQHPPLWEREEEWGNDGLVTIQSAKWGEFLGVMEGCDHWEMRGARGIAPGVIPTSLGKVPGLGKMDLSMNLGVGDWGKFVSAWRTREDANERRSGGDKGIVERRREREQDEADIKSSTDRLSAVMDWFVEQVPLTAKLNLSGGQKTGTVKGEKKDKKDKEKKNELGTMEDLERFYVALSRKLWDEGL
jgi:triacylglycerol lipase